MTDHAVVIAGGGPTRLMLAAELALVDEGVCPGGANLLWYNPVRTDRRGWR